MNWENHMKGIVWIHGILCALVIKRSAARTARVGSIHHIVSKWFFSKGWHQKKLFSETEKYLQGPMKDEWAEITEWVVKLCFPIDACLGRDRCIRSHTGPFCESCKVKYYRVDDTSGRCVACGWEQVLGILIMV